MDCQGGNTIFSKEIFPARLRELRNSCNLTQQQLAAELGIVKQTVNNWEVGYRTPPLESLWQLADYFNVTLDYLVGRSDAAGRDV